MTTPAVVADIILESTLQTSYPLPLASHWNASENTNYFGWTPTYWVEALTAGHHVLPVVYGPVKNDDNTFWTTHFSSDLLTLGGWNVPIAVKHTQWEALLYDAGLSWFVLANDDNPCVISTPGNIPTAKVCPIGATNNRLVPWQEVGARFATGNLMTALQTKLPEPAMILHMSNNEATIQKYDDIETTNKRFVDLYGTGNTAQFQRDVVAAGYPSLYSAMIESFRTTMDSAYWVANSTIAGYNNDGKYSSIMGRFSGWASGSTFTQTPTQWSWNRDAWDGDSVSYYWTGSASDSTAGSMDVGWSNGLFAIDQARTDHPGWWHEISYWDGNNYPSNMSTDVRQLFSSGTKVIQGVWTPDRYVGHLQYGMWINRPRVVREFRGASEQKVASVDYWDALVDAVDRVWNDDTLTSFWRSSTLIPNTQTTPWSSNVPTEYSSENRWYLLDTNLDPGPFSLSTEVHVYALARVDSNGNHLVYAHSPKGPRSSVQITIPSVATITVDVPVEGAFYLRTSGGTVTTLLKPRKPLTVARTPRS